MSRIEQLIGEIEMYLDSCKAQAFSNSKRIVVEKDVIDEMLVELRMRIPDEIKKCQKMIANRDAILTDAKTNADKIIADANKKTKSFWMKTDHSAGLRKIRRNLQQGQGRSPRVVMMPANRLRTSWTKHPPMPT